MARLKIGGFAILIARQATPKDTFVSIHVGDYQKQSCPDGPEVHVRVPHFEKRLMGRKSNQRIKSNQIKSNQIKSINGSSQWIKSNQTFWSETFATYFFRISSDPVLNPMYIDPCIQQSYTILMYINNISNSWTHRRRFLHGYFQRTDEATRLWLCWDISFPSYSTRWTSLRSDWGTFLDSTFNVIPAPVKTLGFKEGKYSIRIFMKGTSY